MNAQRQPHRLPKAENIYLELTPRAAMGLARLLEHIDNVGGISPEIYGSRSTHTAFQRARSAIDRELCAATFACEDCLRLTFDEYYVVQHDIWAQAGMDKGMLCIGCLEKRIGRQLIAADFLPCLANTLESWKRSPRLLMRLSASSSTDATGTPACS